MANDIQANTFNDTSAVRSIGNMADYKDRVLQARGSSVAALQRMMRH